MRAERAQASGKLGWQPCALPSPSSAGSSPRIPFNIKIFFFSKIVILLIAIDFFF